MNFEKLPRNIINCKIRFQFVMNEYICIDSDKNVLIPFPNIIEDKEYFVYYKFIGIYDVILRKPVFGIMYNYYFNKLNELFVGYFHDVQIEGTGISTKGNILDYLSDQRSYIGNFKNGRLHGAGFMEELGSSSNYNLVHNMKCSGEWKDGELLFEYDNFSSIVLEEHKFIEKRWLPFEKQIQRMFSQNSNIIIKTTPELIQEQNDLYDAKLSPLYVDTSRIDSCWHFYLHLIRVLQFILE